MAKAVFIAFCCLVLNVWLLQGGYLVSMLGLLGIAGIISPAVFAIAMLVPETIVAELVLGGAF